MQPPTPPPPQDYDNDVKQINYLSVAHTSQDAMMRDFKYQRTNFQLNLDYQNYRSFHCRCNKLVGKYRKSRRCRSTWWRRILYGLF